MQKKDIFKITHISVFYFPFLLKQFFFPDDCLLLQFAPDLAQLRDNGLKWNQVPKTA